LFFSSYIPPGKDILGVDVGNALPVAQQLRHPLTRAVVEPGYSVEPVRLNQTSHSMIIGLALTGRDYELNYRLVDQQTVFVNSYRAIGRSRGKKGIANPFIGFNRFIECAARPESGIQRMIGFVHGSEQDKDGFRTDRLIRFFHRHINGRIIRQDWYGAWLYIDMKDYLPMRQVFKNRMNNQQYNNQAVG